MIQVNLFTKQKQSHNTETNLWLPGGKTEDKLGD